MKKIFNLLLSSVLFCGFLFTACSNNASPENENPGQTSDSAAVIASYSSGSCTYTFLDDSKVVIHVCYEDNSDPEIRVIYDYDQSVGQYTGNPEQDGDVVITTTKRAGGTNSAPNPNLIPRAVARDAADPVQAKIDSAKAAGAEYVVITNEEIPLEEIVNETPVTITISESFFEVEERAFGKTILPSKKLIASFKDFDGNDCINFYNDNTFVYHDCFTRLWLNQITTVMWDYDRVVGTYSGDPRFDGEIVITFTKWDGDNHTNEMAKIEAAVANEIRYVLITNEEFPLYDVDQFDFNPVATYSISNGILDLGSDDLYVRVSTGL